MNPTEMDLASCRIDSSCDRELGHGFITRRETTGISLTLQRMKTCLKLWRKADQSWKWVNVRAVGRQKALMGVLIECCASLQSPGRDICHSPSFDDTHPPIYRHILLIVRCVFTSRLKLVMSSVLNYLWKWTMLWIYMRTMHKNLWIASLSHEIVFCSKRTYGQLFYTCKSMAFTTVECPLDSAG